MTKPIAVIHSQLELGSRVLQTEPYLELAAGIWQSDLMRELPEVLFQVLMEVLAGDR